MTPGRNPDYDDIVLTTKGTEVASDSKNGKTVAFAREERFTFRDGKYQKSRD